MVVQYMSKVFDSKRDQTKLIKNQLQFRIEYLFIFHFQADIPAGLGFGQGEYYPYVYFKINIDMIGNQSVM